MSSCRGSELIDAVGLTKLKRPNKPARGTIAVEFMTLFVDVEDLNAYLNMSGSEQIDEVIDAVNRVLAGTATIDHVEDWDVVESYAGPIKE